MATDLIGECRDGGPGKKSKIEKTREITGRSSFKIKRRQKDPKKGSHIERGEDTRKKKEMPTRETNSQKGDLCRERTEKGDAKFKGYGNEGGGVKGQKPRQRE